jgi:FkbM family methyltransferase
MTVQNPETAGDGRFPPFGTFAPTPREQRIIRLTSAMPQFWLGKRLAFALRKLATKGLNHPLDVEVFGQRMRLNPFANVAAKRILFTPQYFDGLERGKLAAKAEATAGEFVFLDIGANVGGWSMFVAGLLGPRARVLAFEPQPSIRDELAFNIAQNPDSNITLYPYALCDKDGEVEMYLAPHNRGESSLQQGTKHAAPIRVPGRTLLGVLQEAGVSRVHGLKIDVEGVEDLVLIPFLDKAPDALLPEMVVIEDSRRRWKSDVIAALEARGYAVTSSFRMNLVLERPTGA